MATTAAEIRAGALGRPNFQDEASHHSAIDQDAVQDAALEQIEQTQTGVEELDDAGGAGPSATA